MTGDEDGRAVAALGYVRTAWSGADLDRQRAAIEAGAASEGIELLRIHADEGAVGSDLDRDGRRALREAVASKTATVVTVEHVERLSRCSADQLSLHAEFGRFGAGLHHERHGRLAAAGVRISGRALRCGLPLHGPAAAGATLRLGDRIEGGRGGAGRAPAT